MKYLIIAITILIHLTILQENYYSTMGEIDLGMGESAVLLTKSNLRFPNCKIATITKYSSVETCGTTCTNAHNLKSEIGDVACPRNIKLGKRILINDSIYTCNDRTALKHNGRYDLFAGYGIKAYNEAIQFGKQQLYVCQ